MKRLGSKGDTIVEVLLAIAVVSAVLGGAFVSVSNSFNGTRRAQERGEAFKLVEAQFERLREAARDPAKDVFGAAPNPFCLDVNLNKTGPCSVGSSNRYNISIQRTGNTFVATANWSRAGGGTDTVRMTYKVYDETNP